MGDGETKCGPSTEGVLLSRKKEKKAQTQATTRLNLGNIMVKCKKPVTKGRVL